MPQSLRDSIPKKKFDRNKVSDFVISQITNITQDRSEHLNRQIEFLSRWNDYLYPLRKGPWANSSNLHLPLTMEKAKALHAKIVHAFFGVRPWFHIKEREKLDAETVRLKDQMMQWTLTSYINHYDGIFDVMDSWFWLVVTEGWSILKLRWERLVRKATIFRNERNEQTGEIVEVEDKTDNVIFDGPVLEILRQEDCFMLGNYDDIQKAPFFAHRTWMSESQLRRLAGDGFFDKQAVNKILEQNKVKDEKAGSKSRTGIIPENSYVSEEKDIQEGVVTVTSLANKPEFEIFETYMTYDMDEDGFDEEIIVWVEGKTREIVRHTDLDRVCSDGKRPFFKGDLIKRPGRSYSIGLAELLYPLNTELDAIHNQQIDFGTITTIPFFIYTPMSGLKQEEIRLEPGVGIPVDDVNSFRFPQFPQNLNFHQSQEEDIRRMANDLTALQGPSIGQAPSPLGAGRTATGLTTILQESNLQLDIFIKRLQSTYAKLLKSLDVMIQSRIPDGITIRVLGADGIQVKNETGENEFKTIKTRFELNGNVDYELLANSASLNRELDFQKAMLRNQVLVNPLDLQIGLQNIETIYENRKDWLKKQGEIDPDKFLVKPKMIEKPMTPEEEVAFIVQGKKPRLTLNDDHRLKIDVLSAFANSPEFKKGIEFGNIHKDAQVIMRDVIKEHTGLMESASAQAQTSNVTGLQIAPSLSARVAGTMDQKEGIAQGMVGVNQETPAGPAPGGA